MFFFDTTGFIAGSITGISPVICRCTLECTMIVVKDKNGNPIAQVPFMGNLDQEKNLFISSGIIGENDEIDFFNFSEDGDTLLGSFVKPFSNSKIGENGFEGYIFRLWNNNLPELSRRKVAVRRSYVLDKHFRGINVEGDPTHIYKITRTGQREISDSNSLKNFVIVRYKNPEYQD